MTVKTTINVTGINKIEGQFVYTYIITPISLTPCLQGELKQNERNKFPNLISSKFPKNINRKHVKMDSVLNNKKNFSFLGNHSEFTTF